MKDLKLIIVASVVLVLFLYGYWKILLSISPDLMFNPSAWSNTGVFGDSFGGLTAFFSGITLLFLLYTIHLQRREIADSKEDFNDELTTSKRQRYESEFFSMIEIHLANLRHLEITDTRSTSKGLEYFTITGVEAIRKSLDQSIVHALQSDLKPSVYSDRLKSNGLDYASSQYVRSLAVAYDSIVRYSTDPNVRVRYIRILKAYVSVMELKFLSLHCAYAERNAFSKDELKSLSDFLDASGLWEEAKVLWKGQLNLPDVNAVQNT